MSRPERTDLYDPEDRSEVEELVVEVYVGLRPEDEDNGLKFRDEKKEKKLVMSFRTTYIGPGCIPAKVFIVKIRSHLPLTEKSKQEFVLPHDGNEKGTVRVCFKDRRIPVLAFNRDRKTGYLLIGECADDGKYTFRGYLW